MDGTDLVQLGEQAAVVHDPTSTNSFLREVIRDILTGVIAGLIDSGEEPLVERVVNEAIELLVNGEFPRSEIVQEWIDKTITTREKGREATGLDVKEIDRRLTELVTQVMIGQIGGLDPEFMLVNDHHIVLTDCALTSTLIAFKPEVI